MTRRVILAGGGHAHLAVLNDWASEPLHDAECWLVTSSRRTAYSGMLPGWLAGSYRADELLIDLGPLAQKAGAKLVVADVVGLDAPGRSLRLSSGETVEFDLLSLAVGGATDTANLGALGEKLVPVRPVEAFMERWSAFVESLRESAPHVVVVGGGAAGVELAFGVDAALRARKGAANVALVAPEDGFLAGHTAGVRRRAARALARRGIAVHFALASALPDGLVLSCGRCLPADLAIAATGTRAPRWLTRSGLARDREGFVTVDSTMRSTSHAAIFAAGDIVARLDRRLARSGVHAVKAGPVVAANIRRALGGRDLAHFEPRETTLALLSTADGRAILSWGKLAASGRLVWRLKDWIDRRFIDRYRLHRGR